MKIWETNPIEIIVVCVIIIAAIHITVLEIVDAKSDAPAEKVSSKCEDSR